MKKYTKRFLVAMFLFVLALFCCAFLFSPKPEVLDMEMIAMLRELYGDELVRKEYGEDVLEACKKIELFPDIEDREKDRFLDKKSK